MKKTKKRRTREETMQIIKDNTFELLQKEGYSRLTVNKIAQESDVNISLMYRYFPNGLSDILQEIGKDLLNNAQKAPDLINIDDPKDFLRKILFHLIKIHRSNSLILKSLTIEYLTNPEIFMKENKLLITSGSEANIFTKILPRLGLPDDENINEISQFIMHSVDALIHRHIIIVDVLDTDEKLVDYLSDMIMNFIDK